MLNKFKTIAALVIIYAATTMSCSKRDFKQTVKYFDRNNDGYIDSISVFDPNLFKHYAFFDSNGNDIFDTYETSISDGIDLKLKSRVSMDDSKLYPYMAELAGGKINLQTRTLTKVLYENPKGNIEISPQEILIYNENRMYAIGPDVDGILPNTIYEIKNKNVRKIAKIPLVEEVFIN